MKKVIIIGASSGIGENLAKQYALQGNLVGIAARRIEKLEKIKSLSPDNISCYYIDVSKKFEKEEPGVKEDVLRIIKSMGGVDIVIYCSGVGEKNHILDLEVEYNMVNVNVLGFIEVANAVVDYVILGNEVTFATISSIASIRGIGVSAAYSATKMFQVRYMEALAQLANKNGWKLNTVTIKPGFIDTDFIRGSNYPMTMKLNYAARLIKKAIDKKRKETIINWKWKIVAFFWRLIPKSLWYKIKI